MLLIANLGVLTLGQIKFRDYIRITIVMNQLSREEALLVTFREEHIVQA